MSKPLFEYNYGRLRDVTVGPDGYLYILTSNRDGRGDPAQNDDRILRIVPLNQNKILGDSFFSPREQTAMGVQPYDVKCKEGLELIFKINGLVPVCVKHSSIDRLIETGWA